LHNPVSIYFRINLDAVVKYMNNISVKLGNVACQELI